MASTIDKLMGRRDPEPDQSIDPAMDAALLEQPSNSKTIGTAEIRKATEILRKYQDAKATLDQRIIDDEMWYEGRQWEAIRSSHTPLSCPKHLDTQTGVTILDDKGNPIKRREPEPSPEPSTAWLFNSILNKHADAMDSYPTTIVLPREKSDEEAAKKLSSILPVVMEQTGFESVYDRCWWEKLKHGTAVYSPTWSKEKENGLGDVDIKQIDLLRIYWEPGIEDIQRSRNLFILDLVDNDLLKQRYPKQLRGQKWQGVTDAITVKQYVNTANADLENKSVVVDWYYKVQTPGGRTVLHYCKFVGDTLLYSSQNDPNYRAKGWYDHGRYPVIFDVLYPIKGTPVGFGLVALCRSPQLYIDKLMGNVLEMSMQGTKRRYFATDDVGVNEEELLDWNQPIVHVAGLIDDSRLREMVARPLDSIYLNVAQMMIEGMKETVANRDVNSGGAGGATAAAAIAALQAAGNKASRDMIRASYRVYVDIGADVIELMRQFYTTVHEFRIDGPNGNYEFTEFDGREIGLQVTGQDSMGHDTFRKPIFDLKIKAEKQNPFTRMEQNERALNMYQAGFFAPENAQAALIALESMDFEGVEQIKEKVQEGQTLYNMMQQAMARIQALEQTLDAVRGVPTTEGSAPIPTGGQSGPTGEVRGDRLHRAVTEAQAPMTDYGDRLAKNAVVSPV